MGMTLKELRERLNHLHDLNEKVDNLQVAVITNEPTCGCRSHVNVKSISVGFDWESGLLILTPDEPIIKETKEE